MTNKGVILVCHLLLCMQFAFNRGLEHGNYMKQKDKIGFMTTENFHKFTNGYSI